MNKTSIKVRQITDAAVISAIYCVFLLISRFTGGTLEYDLFFLLPIPIALYAFKYGFKLSAIPLFATSILSVFICTTYFNSVVYVLPGLFIGSLFGGVLVKSKLNAPIQILIITAVCLLMEVLSGYVLSAVLGITNIFEDIGIVIDWMSNIFPNNDSALLKAIMEGLIPSIFVIMSLVEALLIYLLFTLIVYKMKMFRFTAKKPSFSFKYAPIWLTIVYLVFIVWIIVGFILFSNENLAVHIICDIGINGFIILTVVYMYFGMKYWMLFLRLKGWKWGIILLYLFVLIPPLQLVLSITGIIDSFLKLTDKLLNQGLSR